MALEYDLVVRDGTGMELLLEGRPADPESCFLLDDVQGLDGRDLREIVEPLPDRDGDYLGPTRQTGLGIVVAGFIIGVDRADLRLRERRLRAAMAPSTTGWRLRVQGRIGDPEDLVTEVRTSSPFRAPDRAGDSRRVKPFQVGLRSADAVFYGASEQSATVAPVVASAGFTFPITFPLLFGETTGEATAVVNAGDARAWPVLRIHGPATGVVIENLRTGDRLTFPGSIAAGEFLQADSATRVITLGGLADASRYSALDRPNSRWWPLEPGSNPIRLRASVATGDARVEVTWRNAYQ